MKKTALIVDDNDKNRKLLRVILSSKGFDTIESENGEGAMKLAVEKMPAVVLLDYKMPGMNGIAVSKALKAQQATAKIPVIIVTSSAMGGDRERIMRESRCDAYFSKPIDINEVVNKVEELILGLEGRGS